LQKCKTIKKMRKYVLFYSLLLMSLAACKTDPAPSSEKKIEAIESKDVNDFVRMPVTADGEVDTENVAKMEFEETAYDFGTVKKGTKVSHTYKFENTGKVPLIITDARSTCGCTVPTYPKKPIAPGKGGKIKVVFDTTNFSDRQGKPVTITANTYPNKTELMIKGNIE